MSVFIPTCQFKSLSLQCRAGYCDIYKVINKNWHLSLQPNVVQSKEKKKHCLKNDTSTISIKDVFCWRNLSTTAVYELILHPSAWLYGCSYFWPVKRWHCANCTHMFPTWGSELSHGVNLNSCDMMHEPVKRNVFMFKLTSCKTDWLLLCYPLIMKVQKSKEN